MSGKIQKLLSVNIGFLQGGRRRPVKVLVCIILPDGKLRFSNLILQMAVLKAMD
jgi:hypothetical protein